MKSSSFANRLDEILKIRGIRAAHLSVLCGINKSTISQYLSGRYEAKYDRMVELANVLGCDPRWLAGEDVPMTAEENSQPELTLPVLNYKSAAKGQYSEQQVLGREPIERKYSDGSYCFVEISGDSMSPKLDDGDRALIHMRAELASGQIGLVEVDGDYSVNRVSIGEDTITLSSINPNWPPRVFRGEDCARVRIIGSVVKSVKYW